MVQHNVYRYYLLYGTEACPLNRSFDIAINRFLMKLLKTIHKYLTYVVIANFVNCFKN